MMLMRICAKNFVTFGRECIPSFSIYRSEMASVLFVTSLQKVNAAIHRFLSRIFTSNMSFSINMELKGNTPQFGVWLFVEPIFADWKIHATFYMKLSYFRRF